MPARKKKGNSKVGNDHAAKRRRVEDAAAAGALHSSRIDGQGSVSAGTPLRDPL